jgi:hypothetical protein
MNIQTFPMGYELVNGAKCKWIQVSYHYTRNLCFVLALSFQPILTSDGKKLHGPSTLYQ